MVKRPTPFATKRAGDSLGANLAAWRRLLGLPASVIAEHAGISVSTLSRLENGDTGVGLATFLNVANALGIRDAVVQATDPFETDLGRARAELALPKLVRR
ncbi:helix-turn-helix transcriptional regulator [Propioniciclava soli]|uniref:Helix-turn-helix transcriptional regulator n=1 Tax=Propioniciclava soli TaxID=2775081 RepID=A0ABZ3C6Z7_9ACTN